MVRTGNNFLQTCKQLGAVTSRDWTPGPDGDVSVMREAMGVLQHHDAVSGTAKQAVTFDYAQRLAEGFSECRKVIDFAYKYLAPKSQSSPKPDQIFCPLLNITQCEVTETSDKFVVNVYNPLARKVSRYIRLPVAGTGYDIIAPNGEAVTTQIIPIPQIVRLIPGRRSRSSYELIFRADLPPLGFKSFYISKNTSSKKAQLSKIVPINRKITVGNDMVNLGVDENGNLKRIIMKNDVLELNQTFGYYEGHGGNNSKFNLRASGAYIFRPANQNPHIFSVKSNSNLIKGPLVQEIHQEFNAFISNVVRIYAGSPDVELEWLIGPIPISDGIGKEVITRYRTNIASQATFFTDSNGRQLLERVRNFRPTWKLNVTEPVSGNYYPVNSRIGVKQSNNNAQLTVLTDRSQGGTSMHDGEVELMLHRRLLYDDAFGVGEALNESAYGQGLVVRGKHWVQVSPPEYRFAGSLPFPHKAAPMSDCRRPD